MQRWGMIVVLIGVLGTAGIVVAHEGEHGHDGEMPAAMKAIKDKYQAQKEQLHADCKQKLQALEQAEHSEMRAAMETEHKNRIEEMEGKYQQHMQDMNKHWDEHMQEMQKKHEESPQQTNQQ